MWVHEIFDWGGVLIDMRRNISVRLLLVPALYTPGETAKENQSMSVSVD